MVLGNVREQCQSLKGSCKQREQEREEQEREEQGAVGAGAKGAQVRSVEYNQSIDICLLAYISLRAQIQ